TEYLIAWTDFRNGSAPILGKRVSADGVVLDTAGILVSSGRNGSVPKAASDGSDFFVAWYEWKMYDTDIVGARVDAAGFVLDTAGILVAKDSDMELSPSVASNGHEYLVAWSQALGG